MSKKSKPLRNADFSAPRKISPSDFDVLCKTFKIPTSHHTIAKERLDELVTDLDARVKAERQYPNRQSDRDHLEKALAHTKKAANHIGKLGPGGRRATWEFSASVAPMLTAQWLNEKFPGDDLAPRRSRLPSAQGARPSIRTAQRDPAYFIEEKSLKARMEFVQRRSVETTIAALDEIIEGLKRSMQSLDLQPGSRGGRPLLKYRRYLIICLGEIWRDLDKQISTSATSDFAEFCEAVADSIGWPTEGISPDIPKAIRAGYKRPAWRNLPPKNHR